MNSVHFFPFFFFFSFGFLAAQERIDWIKDPSKIDKADWERAYSPSSAIGFLAWSPAMGEGDLVFAKIKQKIYRGYIDSSSEQQVKLVLGNNAQVSPGDSIDLKVHVPAGKSSELLWKTVVAWGSLTEPIYIRKELQTAEKIDQVFSSRANFLIKNYKPNINLIFFNNSILALAARYSNLAAVKLLVGAGANINLKNDNKITPLCYVLGVNILSFYTPDPERVSSIALYLLERGANPNIFPTPALSTPLINAVERNYYSVVEKLIQSGAAIDQKNNLGETALKIAQEKNYQNIVDLLKSHGATE